MTTALTFLILISPIAVAVTLSWAAHRTGSLRLRLDQFRMAGPMSGRFFGPDLADDRDAFRVDHDVDAVRTRFEKQPFWPASGSLSEGR
jgi:hypothetical protein